MSLCLERRGVSRPGQAGGVQPAGMLAGTRTAGVERDADVAV
ncbi:hypothetical protein [Janthinobacterium sp. MDB2-8]